MNITEFEQRVIAQKPVESGHYDSEYFTGDWRAEGNNYNLETRRQIEAKNPSLIKETIVRKEPDFDEREAGFSTFSRLLQEMERQGLLKRQQLNGRQWYVLPPDAPAAGAESAGESAAGGSPEEG